MPVAHVMDSAEDATWLQLDDLWANQPPALVKQATRNAHMEANCSSPSQVFSFGQGNLGQLGHSNRQDLRCVNEAP